MSATETFDLLKLAFADECLKRSATFEWFSRFKNGRDFVEDDEHVGCPILHRQPENIDREGIVRYEYLEEGQAINKEVYLNILRCFRE